MLDSKSSAARLVGSSPTSGTDRTLAFVIGVALGDGNLSNPNGRAVRLRVTCDLQYPGIIRQITDALQTLMPQNKVAIVHRSEQCLDVSCYSNKWELLLGWRADGGSKVAQQVCVPDWILGSKTLTTACLKGLFLTDGSIYQDRGYTMVNFTSVIKPLANNVFSMVSAVGYMPKMYEIRSRTCNRHPKFVVRIARDASRFVEEVGCQKY